jgi:hypothetical protein
LLRVWELTFTRMGRPSPEVCSQIAAKLDPLFPATDPLANRELVSLLSYLGSTSIVAKTVPMLSTTKDTDITISNANGDGGNIGPDLTGSANATPFPTRWITSSNPPRSSATNTAPSKSDSNTAPPCRSGHRRGKR